MQASVSIATTIFLTVLLAASICRLAQCQQIQRAAQTFATSRELKAGVLLLVGGPIAILIEAFHGTNWQTATPETIAASHSLGGLNLYVIQFAWTAAVILLSVYTHLLLIAAYSEYQRYPPLDAQVWWAKYSRIYRRWTYLLRTQYKSPIFTATPLILLGILGMQLGVPTEVAGAITLYHSVVMAASTHGSKHIDYREEKQALYAPSAEDEDSLVSSD